MVGTDDAAGAASGRPVEQSRRAMPAHVMKSAHPSVIAPEGEQRFAQEIERLIVARVRNFRDMADGLP